MRTEEFAAADWVERLAQAIAELATTQERYRDELDQERQRRVRIQSELPGWRAFDHPSHDLQNFYSRACSGKDRYYAGYHGPLCNVLAEVRRVLAEHPAWADLVNPFGDRDEVRIEILNHSSSRSLLSVISGLIARGLEVPEDGFKVAATELHGLLAPGGDPERGPGSDNLAVGYQVALFHGLRVSEKIPLADDMALLPFKQLDAFVNEGVLEDIEPVAIRYSDQQSIGALVKPFRWKPEFRKPSDAFDPDLDWGRPFFTDAEAFVELLALFHAAPVICLALIPYCIHRTAAYLLGESLYNRSWSLSARSLDLFAEATDLRADALGEATRAFGHRKSEYYRDCAPVIARLAEALARNGRFQTEDKILDVAIALERMYELEGDGINFKLKARAACFLETSTEGRARVFRDVGEFYDVRSAIVHKRKPKNQPSGKAKQEAFSKGFEVARRSVVKLLRDGPPPDWNAMVIAGIDSGAGEPQSNDGTTALR